MKKPTHTRRKTLAKRNHDTTTNSFISIKKWLQTSTTALKHNGKPYDSIIDISSFHPFWGGQGTGECQLIGCLRPGFVEVKSIGSNQIQISLNQMRVCKYLITYLLIYYIYNIYIRMYNIYINHVYICTEFYIYIYVHIHLHITLTSLVCTSTIYGSILVWYHEAQLSVSRCLMDMADEEPAHMSS